MRKVLKQKAQVTDEYKSAFESIYPKLIEGRYSKGDGSLMKWIKESNPNFDVSLYQSANGWREFKRIAAHHELVCRPSVNKKRIRKKR